jgi:hypothetical protein
METMGSEKARMPTFDGKKENFETWKMRWEAFAMMENFSSAIGDKVDPNMPAKYDVDIDDTTAKGQAQVKARKANMRAVAYYTMAMKSVRLMAVINKSKSTEWPGGLAWKINESLIKKYRPNDIVAQAEMRLRLKPSTMVWARPLTKMIWWLWY